jgi:hypothetical protein
MAQHLLEGTLFHGLHLRLGEDEQSLMIPGMLHTDFEKPEQVCPVKPDKSLAETSALRFTPATSGS